MATKLRDRLVTPKSSKESRACPQTEILKNTPAFATKFARTLEIVAAAEHELLICSGELGPRYYDSKEMLELFSKKLLANVKITVTAGPALSVEDHKAKDLMTFKERWIDYRESGKSIDRKFIDGVVNLKPAFRYLFFGEPSTGNKFEFYFTSRRDRLNYLIADDHSAIVFPQPIMQSECEIVYIYKHSPSPVEDLRSSYRNSLPAKKRIETPEQFFDCFSPSNVDTVANLRARSEGVLLVLENPKYSWRTVEGIARELDLDTDFVRDVLDNSKDVVSLRRPASEYQGCDNVYTTRERYRTVTPLARRLISAFANQLK